MNRDLNPVTAAALPTPRIEATAVPIERSRRAVAAWILVTAPLFLLPFLGLIGIFLLPLIPVGGVLGYQEQGRLARIPLDQRPGGRRLALAAAWAAPIVILLLFAVSVFMKR